MAKKPNGNPKAKKASKADLRLTTPKGLAKYPFLFKPSTTFNKDGVYKISVVLKGDDSGVKECIAQINAFAEENGVDNVPYEFDKDANTYTLQFKSTHKPHVVDAQAKPIGKELPVGNDSVVRVSGSLNYYEGFGGGVNLYLNAVQIIDLVEYMPGADAFDKEEGYTFDEKSREKAPEGGDAKDESESNSNDDF